jgi:Mn2+/Fe2+ NRAMP family transporter
MELAAPHMVVIILLVCNNSVMGPFTASRPIVILGWVATIVMCLAAVRVLLAHGRAPLTAGFTSISLHVN